MNSRTILFPILLLFLFQTALTSAAQSHKQSNGLFAATHLLPSPFGLPAGRLSYGTAIGVGVTDYLTLSTNIVADVSQIYNASAKFAILDTPGVAAAITLGWQSMNYKNISSLNPDLSVMSWLPGAVVAFELAEPVALAVGGNLSFSDVKLVTDGVVTSGYVQGARAETDLMLNYYARNVLAFGVSYDFSYQLMGVGVSHHFPGFQLGVHYYPKATTGAVEPIVSGGGSLDL